MADGRALAAVLAVAFATSATAADFSEQLDTLWTFGKPAESEVRFRAELAKYPDEEAAELSLIYQARGLGKDDADRMAARIVANPVYALDALAREELGLDPSALGSPIGAALFSFAAFAVGALVPLAPFVVGVGEVRVARSEVDGGHAQRAEPRDIGPPVLRLRAAAGDRRHGGDEVLSHRVVETRPGAGSSIGEHDVVGTHLDIPDFYRLTNLKKTTMIILKAPKEQQKWRQTHHAADQDIS